MVGPLILAAFLSLANPTAERSNESINLFDVCDKLYSGTEIKLGKHQVAKKDDGVCEITNMENLDKLKNSSKTNRDR